MIKVLMATASVIWLALSVPQGNALPLPSVTPDGLSAAKMIEARQQPTPLGYVLFCMNNSGECASSGSSRMALDEKTWESMEATNREINARIQPDAAKGTTNWSLSTTVGNCNDYAVQKKAKLVAEGFPARALSLSVVVTPRGDGHLILTVRTDKGDFVLDNLRDAIVPWTSTGYRWVSVQSSVDQNRWVQVRATKETPRVLKVGNRQATRKKAPTATIPRTFSGAPAFILK